MTLIQQVCSVVPNNQKNASEVSRWSKGVRLCSSGVVSLPESRPAAHAPRSHRTPGLQTPPPRRLLSSLPHGPHGMLGKRSYHHHSRAEPDRRSGALTIFLFLNMKSAQVIMTVELNPTEKQKAITCFTSVQPPPPLQNKMEKCIHVDLILNKLLLM